MAEYKTKHLQNEDPDALAEEVDVFFKEAPGTDGPWTDGIGEAAASKMEGVRFTSEYSSMRRTTLHHAWITWWR